MKELTIPLRIKFKDRRKEKYKNISKEERANALNNIICPKCKYQNHKNYVERCGKCHLCGTILSKEYFKKSFNKFMEG